MPTSKGIQTFKAEKRIVKESEQVKTSKRCVLQIFGTHDKGSRFNNHNKPYCFSEATS